MDDEEFSSEKNVKVIGIIIFLSTVTEKELYGVTIVSRENPKLDILSVYYSLLIH